ncbi:MAG: alanine--glyoxylate aminotransferase family protein [Deltaproteobacteria bacterium]|nr:alanine--glyoxylate aminotransferase family protein [Deltaproteobacteria bacterium]
MQRLHEESTRVLGYIEGILNYKNTPSYVLLNPGPVLTTPKVKAALVHHDMCHRDDDFSALVQNLRKKLKKVFKGGDDHEVVMITGSGTSGIEAAISSSVPEDKKILVVVNGAFGERYVEVSKVHRLGLVEVNFGWRNEVDTKEIERHLVEDEDIAVVMMAHHETSTGILNPVNEVGELCRKHNKLFIVDAVSSLGAEKIDVVEDNIDICLSSANKAIHAIAGVAFVCISDKAWNTMRDIRPRVYYLDLKRYRKYAVDIEQTPFTPAVSSFFALDAAIDELLEDGVERRWDIYQERNQFIRTRLKEMGLRFLTETGNESHTITVVEVPDYIKYQDLYNTMKSYGYILYGAKDELEDKYFQISNMGALNEEILTSFLDTLRFVLFKARGEMPANISGLSPVIIKTHIA